MDCFNFEILDRTCGVVVSDLKSTLLVEETSGPYSSARGRPKVSKAPKVRYLKTLRHYTYIRQEVAGERSNFRSAVTLTALRRVYPDSFVLLWSLGRKGRAVLLADHTLRWSSADEAWERRGSG